MYATDALDLTDLLDQINAEIYAFLLLVFCPGEALNDVIGNVHAGDVLADPLSRLGRGEGAPQVVFTLSSSRRRRTSAIT